MSELGMEKIIASIDWENDQDAMIGWLVRCPLGTGFIWDVSAPDSNGEHTITVKLDGGGYRSFPAEEVWQLP
jgi:hypothetical protein